MTHNMICMTADNRCFERLMQHGLWRINVEGKQLACRMSEARQPCASWPELWKAQLVLRDGSSPLVYFKFTQHFLHTVYHSIMPLFRGNMVRTGAGGKYPYCGDLRWQTMKISPPLITAIGAACVAHLAMYLIPDSMREFKNSPRCSAGWSPPVSKMLSAWHKRPWRYLPYHLWWSCEPWRLEQLRFQLTTNTGSFCTVGVEARARAKGRAKARKEKRTGSHTHEKKLCWSQDLDSFGLVWYSFTFQEHFTEVLDNEAVRVALRALNQRGVHPSTTGEINLRHAMYPGSQRGPGFKQAKSFGCLADDAYCVVEEWEFFWSPSTVKWEWCRINYVQASYQSCKLW